MVKDLIGFNQIYKELSTKAAGLQTEFRPGMWQEIAGNTMVKIF
jgi:hypothetical protein